MDKLYSPKRLKTSTRVMLGGIAWYPISWMLVNHVMSLSMDPYKSDFIGTILYFSTAIPVIPPAILLVGYFMRLFEPLNNSHQLANRTAPCVGGALSDHVWTIKSC